eukprot:13724782-Alexandrium_andersonii.AAC.1
MAKWAALPKSSEASALTSLATSTAKAITPQDYQKGRICWRCNLRGRQLKAAVVLKEHPREADFWRAKGQMPMKPR